MLWSPKFGSCYRQRKKIKIKIEKQFFKWKRKPLGMVFYGQMHAKILFRAYFELFFKFIS